MESAIKNRFPGYAVRKISRSLGTFQGFFPSNLHRKLVWVVVAVCTSYGNGGTDLTHTLQKSYTAEACRKQECPVAACNASQSAF